MKNSNGNELTKIRGNEIVEFECTFKDQCINGYMFFDEADDEKPLRFYDKNYTEQWHIPSNPYDMDKQMDLWSDYDYLCVVFIENDIIQYLCDFADETKTITLETTKNNEKVLLTINGDD